MYFCFIIRAALKMEQMCSIFRPLYERMCVNKTGLTTAQLLWQITL